MEPEITKPVKLCLDNGRLNPEAVGWSRHPLHTWNLKGKFPRKKRWDYWCITTENFLLSATLSDIDYLGLAFVYFLDFETGYFHEMTITKPLAIGCNLPDTPNQGIDFKNKLLSLKLKTTNSGVHFQVDSPNFDGKKLSADIEIIRPQDHETLNVVIPWSERRFQFTSKQNTLPTKGVVQLGDKQYPIENGFACLDLGRGIWPYSSFWNWAAASGVSNGHTIGLNFGAGWTDGTGMNENGICIDGRLTKINEDVSFNYDRQNLMAPWTLKTESDKVNIQFAPFFQRDAKTDAKILKSEVHQMIGRFSGEIIDEQGVKYSFQDIIGWAEEHFARW